MTTTEERIAWLEQKLRITTGELVQAADRIETLEARLDRAVTRGLEQVERIATLEAALREIMDIRDGVPWNAVAIARAALAPEQDK